MTEEFNLASLASLTRAELQSYLATLTARFNASTSEHDRDYLRAVISQVKQALALN
ncbi:hypothetical protein LCM18_06420 [Qipengyuania flava]|nr:hypothetical protein LCM18_06420 [Qipengyuania flava]